VKVVEYKISDFRELAAGTQAWPWPNGILPVSRQRVAAHAMNPRAHDDDVVLLVGYDSNEIVCYMGILPDCVFLNGVATKFGWLTTWWVKPGVEGMGPLSLLMRAIKLYNSRIGVSEYSESAARIYQAMKSKFRVIVPRTVMLCHLRPDFEQIVARRAAAVPGSRWCARQLTRLSDLVMNCRGLLWNRQARSRVGNLRMEYVGELDSRCRDFLERFDRRAEIFRRDIQELQWMLRHKWAVVTPLADSQTGRYAFSANARRFEFIVFQLQRDDGSIGALMILSIRDDMLKIPYAFIESDMYNAAGLAVCFNALALRARSLMIADAALTQAVVRQEFPQFMRKNIERNSLCTLKEELPAELQSKHR